MLNRRRRRRQRQPAAAEKNAQRPRKWPRPRPRPRPRQQSSCPLPCLLLRCHGGVGACCARSIVRLAAAAKRETSALTEAATAAAAEVATDLCIKTRYSGEGGNRDASKGRWLRRQDRQWQQRQLPLVARHCASRYGAATKYGVVFYFQVGVKTRSFLCCPPPQRC